MMWRALAIFCLAAIVPTVPVHAVQDQAQPATRVLELDRMLNGLPVFKDGMSCLVSARSDDGYWAAILQVAKDGSENAKLASQPDYPFERPLAATAQVGDAAFPMYRANSRTYYIAASNTSFVDALAGEERAVLRAESRDIATVPFTGMATVVEALRDCASSIKLAKTTTMRLVQPNPDIRIAEPDLTGPFPPNRGAIPITPGRWVGSDNYRSADIRAAREGVVGFEVAVGADGQVSACNITRSSGHAELDDYTCSLVTDRARFDPATDGEGVPVEGTFSTSVRWDIPE